MELLYTYIYILHVLSIVIPYMDGLGLINALRWVVVMCLANLGSMMKHDTSILFQTSSSLKIEIPSRGKSVLDPVGDRWWSTQRGHYLIIQSL